MVRATTRPHVRRVRSAAIVVVVALATAACTSVTFDWKSIGAGAVDAACRNSTHCDLPCSRDRARRDCNSGSRDAPTP